MEGAPARIGNPGDGGVSARSEQLPALPHVNGSGGGFGGGELGDDGGSTGGGFTVNDERNSGVNRWPKQETLALIRIRSEMDAAFRDSNLKGPLWDDVSRKLLELGFHRSAKKCREKFENVYKYHRRTKEGRTSKSDKIYRFSNLLQALESNSPGAFSPPPPVAVKPPLVFMAMSNNASLPSPYNGPGYDQNNLSPISVAPPAVIPMPPPPVMNHKRTFPFSEPNMSGSTNSASSSDASDDEPQKKKKWEDFLGKLMKEMLEKQEELQMKFFDTLDRRERDRVAKEEAWRAQEIAKMNEEHERLVKERSIVATKDAAIVTFLQRVTGRNIDAVPLINEEARERLTDFQAPSMPLISSVQVLPKQQMHQTPPPPPTQEALLPPHREVPHMSSPSTSRWPKAEINALITLRTQLDIKYQENVPKGPLWEEISAEMRKLGYNRNAKRCKEKWENINKYYKKMKESNKKRLEDSKTCPYYDQLDAIYREKTTPIIAQPEQQWPPVTVVMEKAPLPQQQRSRTDAIHKEKNNSIAKQKEQWRLPAMVQETPKQPQATADAEDQGSDNIDDYDDGGDDDGYDDEDRDEEGDGYEIVASKISSMAAV